MDMIPLAGSLIELPKMKRRDGTRIQFEMERNTESRFYLARIDSEAIHVP
jgi:hypothetical protein